jgi:hypothetical protein
MTRALERLAATLFAALAAGFIVAVLCRATVRVSRTFNEGWNAYHASAVFAGEKLYHAPGELVANNYPPLSFLLTAALMHAVPDAVFAGRLLASAAFLAVVLLVALIARAGDKPGERDWLAAGVGAAAFAVYMAVNAPNYLGMDDPQMLAHAIMLAGLVFVARGDRPTSVAAAALLMAAGLFVKHNLVALPIATALWLAWFQRARALLFVASLLLAGVLGLAASRFAFGADFVHGLLAPRQYLPAKAWHDTLQALTPMQALLVLAPLAVVLGRDRLSRLLGIYLVVALAVGALAASGAGVGDNAFYELVIACALAAGRLVALTRPVLALPALRLWAIGAVAFACLCDSDLATAKDMLLLPQWLAAQRARAAEVTTVVDFLAAHPGPALCETAVFCYWAGKPFELDAVNFRQGVLAGIARESELTERLRDGYYATVTLDRPPTELLGPDALAALRDRYAETPVGGTRQAVFVRQ